MLLCSGPSARSSARKAPINRPGFRIGFFLFSLFFLAGARGTGALGPHEILLLVNQDSPASLEIANHYTRLRRIPPANVVHLSLPGKVFDARSQMDPDEFTRYIWEPANRFARERGLEDHILAWVYSADFPIRITSAVPVSLQGITLVRNRLPDPESIKRGTYRSPLYAGPDGPRGLLLESRTLAGGGLVAVASATWVLDAQGTRKELAGAMDWRQPGLGLAVRRARAGRRGNGDLPT